jgi:class 3 adenylate cyclase
MAPTTRYARSSGGAYIAYQVVGEGPLDLVLVPAFLSQIEHLWEEPGAARLLSGLATFSRLILFDRRGTGLSDGTSLATPLDEQIDDVRAVLAAAGSTSAALMAVSEGCSMATMFAATHPEVVRSLILYTPMPRLVWAPDYPWAAPAAERAARMRPLIDCWGQGTHVDVFAPSAARDERLRRWFAELERLAMGPGAAAAHVEVVGDVDVRGILPSVQCPALVMRRSGDTLIDERHVRYAADHIPGARYVELPGSDNYLGVGDLDAPLHEIAHFLTGDCPPVSSERVLATVLFTDIVGSTQRAAELGDQRWRALLDVHDRLLREEVTRHRGRVVKSLGDGGLAVFDAPSRAIASAVAIRAGARELGLEIRAGLHTGECELSGDDVGGLAVHIGARVSELAAAGEVLVSGTVHDLAVGSGLELEDRGEHSLKGVPGAWRTYAVAA